MTFRPALLLAAGLAATAPAATHDDAVARTFAGRVAGTAANCLSADRTGNIVALDARTLVYRESARRVWRNDLPDACPGLDDDAILVFELFGSGPCKGDHFRTIERGGGSIPGPICRLGSFVPYDRPRP
ncbi:hypothetical protein BH10PSE14_BH10PSE14_41150 [soil metagenome]